MNIPWPLTFHKLDMGPLYLWFIYPLRSGSALLSIAFLYHWAYFHGKKTRLAFLELKAGTESQSREVMWARSRSSLQAPSITTSCKAGIGKPYSCGDW